MELLSLYNIRQATLYTYLYMFSSMSE